MVLAVRKVMQNHGSNSEYGLLSVDLTNAFNFVGTPSGKALKIIFRLSWLGRRIAMVAKRHFYGAVKILSGVSVECNRRIHSALFSSLLPCSLLPLIYGNALFFLYGVRAVERMIE